MQGVREGVWFHLLDMCVIHVNVNSNCAWGVSLLILSFKMHKRKEGSSSNYFPTVILRRPDGRCNGAASVSASGLLGKATEHSVLTGTHELAVLQALNHCSIC